MRLLALLLVAASGPALAQSQPAAPGPGEATDPPPAYPNGEDELDEEMEEIVVTGGRPMPRGSVVGDIEPEVVLNARDIRAYGASTVGELLEELAPLTGSIQGRGEGQPVVLLGGRRISGFREVRDLPPEAIARVDILPEEVALKYGYRADQKVVNIVLRRRFEAVTAELETTQATAGGRQSYEADVDYLRIGQGSRLSIETEYGRDNPLFETERDIVDPDPDRTLLAASDAATLNATYNRTIFGNVSATVNGELEGQESLSALGRARDGSQRLLRDRSTRNASLGYALNGDIAQWRWSANGGYERNQSTTLTDRNVADGVGQDITRSVTETLESEATVNGELFDLPAGAVAATVKAGFNMRGIDGRSSRRGTTTVTDLSRDQANGQANLDLPLLDDSPVGSFSANANGSVEQLSDFGTLTTVGYGFNWEPLGAVRLIGSVTHEEGAPSIQQLGNPVLVTPNVRVLDLTTGETVDVTRVEGGNPNLLADERRVMKLGLTVKPIEDTSLTILVNFADTRIDNPTESFPTATPEIEAAFPERFVRDDDGRLLQIDSRPVNFARRERRELRWGFNWSETLEAPPPTGPDGRPLTPEQIEERREAMRQARRESRGPGGPGAGARRPGGGGFGGFGGGSRQGRVQLSIFHTWRLAEKILIRPGLPELDLLEGSAISGEGGSPRHEVELRAGYSRHGLGARLNADWESGTTVLADPVGGAPSPQDLSFGDLLTVNLRLWADLGQQRSLVRDAPFFRGSRVTVAVNNLLNGRREVRDATGAIPVGYRPDSQELLGRTIRISFRKLFS